MKTLSYIAAGLYILLAGTIVCGLFFHLVNAKGVASADRVVSQIKTPTRTPTQTPIPTATIQQSSPTPTIKTQNPVVTGIVKTLAKELATNTNPITDGIKKSYGATSTKAVALPQTADAYDTADKMPSGNEIIDDTIIAIPKLNLMKQVYQGVQIGSMLTVGDNEVLKIKKDTNLFYGHNSASVFGQLYALDFGDTIIVNENNVTSTYKISYVQYLSDQAPTPQAQADTIHLVTCDHTDPHVRLILTAVRI